MTYSGDSSLADDIRDRILATFGQALDLTEMGSRKEALLGCDFVLRLDPLFEPARVLHKRLSAGEPIRTDDLRSALGGDADAAMGLDAMDAAAADLEVTGSLEPPPALEFEQGADGSSPSSFRTAIEEALDDSADPPLSLEEDRELMTDFAHEQVDEHDPPIALASPELETPTFETPSFGEQPDTGKGVSVDTDEIPITPIDDLATAAPREAAPQLDDESQRRIAELLDEGQDAYDAGEYQSAIDAWSRVFLIDIDHGEANRRIEQARRMSAEAERQVEEVFHEAMSNLDSGDLESARDALTRVLDLQPGHLAAQEYLDRIDAGDVSPADRAPLDDIGPATPAGFPLEESYEDVEAAEDLFATPDVAPDTTDFKVSATAPVAKKRPRQAFLLVGSLVLLLVVVGGWFLIDSWDSLFPNSESVQAAAAPKRIDPIARAHKLHEQGKTAIAIAQLRRLPPGDPHYSEAQALVAQWETAESSTEQSGPEPEDLAHHQDLVARARTAHTQSEYLLASSLLDRAVAIAPLDAETAVIHGDAQQALEPLQEQIRIFRSGDWEYALPTLWRMREADVRNADINRLIIDSYYNLGIRDLQRGRPEAAVKKFEEALNLRPNDATLKRLRAFATTYEARSEDLLYRIFVKYLPFR